MVKKSKNERGQALVLVVFGIVALIGITALAVDGGNAYLDRRQAQNAADTAALAGALARIRGETWSPAAYNAAAQNGYNNNGVTNTVEVFSPPVDGEYAGDIEYIQVVITSHVSTYFAGVIGQDTITNRVSAVTRTKTPEYAQIMDGYAVISLAPESNCQNRKSFWLHSESTLDITGGGVFVNSNNPDCAFLQQGNGSIRIRDGYPISVVGGSSIQKPQLLTPYPPTSTFAVAYPPPFMPPKVGCGKKVAEISEDGSTMSPGAWDDVFPPPDVHYLESGTYCIDDFILNGGDRLEGTGVVFDVNGEVRWNGGASINLSAPKKGDLAGLLLYLPIDNHSKVVLNGNSESEIRGTILAPGAELHINGDVSTKGWHSQIIGYTINVSGNSNIVIKYNDEENYDAITMPEIQMTE